LDESSSTNRAISLRCAHHMLSHFEFPLKPHAICYRTSTQNQTPRGNNGPYSRERQRMEDFLGRVDGDGWMPRRLLLRGAEWSVGVSADCCWCSVAGSKSTVARPASCCGGVRGETGRRGPSPHPPQSRIHCGIVGSGHNKGSI
jgi:hypothetical protein